MLAIELVIKPYLVQCTWNSRKVMAQNAAVQTAQSISHEKESI